MHTEPFYIIDHKNCFSLINEDHQTKLQLKMLISCTSIDANSIGNEINKFFSKIIPYNQSDLLLILSALSKSIVKDKRYAGIDSIYDTISLITNPTYCNDSSFALNAFNIDIIGNLLVYVFINEIPSMKLKSYAKFIEAVSKFINDKKDMSTAYNSYRNSLLYDTKAKKPRKNSNSYQMFKEKTIQSKAIEIPIELAFLIERLRLINRIIMPLEVVDDHRFNLILMILFNFNILFSNCTCVCLDMSNVKLTNELYRMYHKELSNASTSSSLIQIKPFNEVNYDEVIKGRWSFGMDHIENLEPFRLSSAMGSFSLSGNSKLNAYYDYGSDLSTTVDRSTTNETIVNSDSNVCDKEKDKDMKSKSIIMEYRRLFELCIIYPYFISQWKTTTSFQLIHPNSFTKEVIETMHYEYKVLLMNYSLFDFFQPINQLTTLTAEFNSLDSETFEKLKSLIILNSRLSTLILSLFTIDLHYQPAALFKLMNRLKINIKNILQQKTIISNTKSLDNDDVDQLFINHLMLNFEENIEELFWVLKDQSTIRDLSLFLVTPTIISNSDSYMIILSKFVFNMLLLLNNGKALYESFKLIVPYLMLDNRIFPGIHDLFEHLDYENSNHCIRSLAIQMQFYSIRNIGRLFTTRLIEVSIGDLDKESFEALVNQITKEEYVTMARLKRINIALLGRVTQYSGIKESLSKYLAIGIRTLEEIMLSSYLNLSYEEWKRMHSAVNYNSIRRYGFILGKGCEGVIMDKPLPVLMYYNVNDNSNDDNNTIGMPVNRRKTQPKRINEMQLKVFILICKKAQRHRQTGLVGRLISFIIPMKEKEIILSFK